MGRKISEYKKQRSIGTLGAKADDKVMNSDKNLEECDATDDL